jgi:hypothetical protein
MPILGVLEVLISIKTTRRIYLCSVKLIALSAILLQSKRSRISRDGDATDVIAHIAFLSVLNVGQ